MIRRPSPRLIREASATPKDAVEAEGEFEDIKDDLEDAVENEGRTGEGVPIAVSVLEARDEVRTLRRTLSLLIGRMRRKPFS